MRTRKTALFIVSIIAVFAFGLFAGCKKKPEPPKPPEVKSEITLRSSLSVEEFKSELLTPVITGTESEITWTSDKPAVATVNGDGVVYGVRHGNAKITATMGESSSTCEVTVTPTALEHTVTLSDSSLLLVKGDSQEVTASVKFDGATLDDGEHNISYEWTTKDPAVAAVVTSGGKATFTATDTGVAEYTVTARVRGYEASKKLTVKVIAADVAIQLTGEDLQQTAGAYETFLKLADWDKTEAAIGDVKIYVNGEFAENAAVSSWTADDDSIAKVENSVIKSVGAGVTEIRGSVEYDGETYPVVIRVNVSRSEKALEDVYTLEREKDDGIDLPTEISATNVETVVVNGNVVLYSKADNVGSVAGNKVTFGEGTLPSNSVNMGEDRDITITTDKVVYSLKTNLYTLILKDKADLDSLGAIAKASHTQQDRWDGYYVLGNDIAYNGAYTSFITYSILNPIKTGSSWSDSAASGFCGVIDGKNHKIEGLEIADNSGGLLGVGHNDCVLKNIIFTKAVLSGNGGYITSAGGGTFENVFIQVDSITSGNDASNPAGFISAKETGSFLTIRSVIVEIRDETINKPHVYGVCRLKPGFGLYRGVYSIGVGRNANPYVANYSAPAEPVSDKQGDYVDYKSLLAAVNSGEVSFVSWDDSFWHVFENGLAVPEKLFGEGEYSFDYPYQLTPSAGEVYAGETFTVTTNIPKIFSDIAVDSVSAGYGVTVDAYTVSTPATDENTMSGYDVTLTLGCVFTDTKAISSVRVKANVLIVVEDRKDVTLDLDVSGGSLVDVGGKKKYTGTLVSGSGAETEIDLGSDYSSYDFGTVKTFSINGVSKPADGLGFSITGSVITLDAVAMASAKGECSLELVCENGAGTTYRIRIPLFVVTKVIDSKQEFDAFRDTAHIIGGGGANWDGYFVLGGDIDYNGEIVGAADTGSIKMFYDYDTIAPKNNYDATYLGFKGTFDGKGYVIKGLSVVNATGKPKDITGLFYGLTGTASFVNVSFINARVAKNCGFITPINNGLIKNVFIQFDAVGKEGERTTSVSWLGRESAFQVIAGTTGTDSTARIISCVIDVSATDMDEDKNDHTGYYGQGAPFASVGGTGDGKIQYKGVYIVFGKNFAEYAVEIGSYKKGFVDVPASNVYGSFESYGDMLADAAASAEIATWDVDGFWQSEEGWLIPQRALNALKAAEVSITASVEEVLPGGTFTITVSPCTTVSADSDKVTINGNTVSVAADIEESSITLTARSVYGESTKSVTVEIDRTLYITLEEKQDLDLDLTVDESQVTVVDVNNKKVPFEALSAGSNRTMRIDLSGSDKTFDELVSVHIGEDDLTSAFTLSDGDKLSVSDPSHLFYQFGEKTLTVKLRSEGSDYILEVPVVMISKVLSDKGEFDDMLRFVAAALGDKNDEGYNVNHKGYFVLDSDITYNGPIYRMLTASGANKAIGSKWTTIGDYGFIGTIDGRGHTVSKITAANHVSGTDGLGAQVHGIFGLINQNGVIKNISFTDITLYNGVPFLSRVCFGTVENVYFGFSTVNVGNANASVISGFENIGYDMYRAGEIKSVVFDFTGTTFNFLNRTPESWFSVFGTMLKNRVADGAYVIGWDGTEKSGGNEHAVISRVDALEGNVYGAFDTVADLKANTAAAAVVAEWDTDFWDLTTLKPKNL